MTQQSLRRTTPKCSEENFFDYVPYPAHCPCCKERNTVVLLHRGKFGGQWSQDKMAYKCKVCGAMVGADNTGVAMGVLGDSTTRKLRKEAHEYFDKLWQQGPSKKFSSRSAAYKALARSIDIEYDDCHFANMDSYTLKAVIKMLKNNEV